MTMFIVLIIYIIVGIIVESKTYFSKRVWKLYVILFFILIFITVIDWLSILF